MTGVRYQFRRDTASLWTTNNPVLLAGEPAVETDTGKLKLGDGATAWNALPYVASLSTSSQPVVTRVTASEGIVQKVVAGAVSDASFTFAPPDGTEAVDSTNGRKYVRIGGTWKYAPLVAASGFNPAAIGSGTLLAWYDFSQTALADGATISTQQDLSGNSHTLAVPSGKAGPVCKQNIQNGKAVARFDGATTGLETPAFTSAQPLTVFIVARASQGTSATEGVLSNGGGTPQLSAASSGNWNVGTGSPGFNSIVGGTKANVMTVVTAVFGGTGNTILRQNGVQVGSKSPDTATASFGKFTFGYGASSSFLNGDIGEVLIYSGALNIADIQAVEAYLA